MLRAWASKQRHRVLGGREDVGLGGVDDENAVARRRIDVDVVETDARPADDLEVLGSLEESGRDLRGRPDDQSVVRSDLLGQLHPQSSSSFTSTSRCSRRRSMPASDKRSVTRTFMYGIVQAEMIEPGEDMTQPPEVTSFKPLGFGDILERAFKIGWQNKKAFATVVASFRDPPEHPVPDRARSSTARARRGHAQTTIASGSASGRSRVAVDPGHPGIVRG